MAVAPSRQRPALTAAAALLALAAPAQAAEARAAEVVRISGTGSALGPLRRLAQAFEAANPGVKVQLLPSIGSSGAAKAVAAGALELGLSGRALRPEEAALGITAVELARTPFLLAVGPRVDATDLDAPLLARIYRGEVSSWPGGERVRPILRPAADADTLYLRSLSAELAAALDAALSRPGLVVAATNQECDEVVARTPGAIGPTTLAALLTDAHGLRALSWQGVAPTLANLSAGRYPLWKPIVALLPDRPSPATRRFLEFLRSPAARAILAAAGCAPSAPPPGG